MTTTLTLEFNRAELSQSEIKLRDKVRAILIKRGNGEAETDRVINAGFEFAITKYTKVSQIANYLIVCY